MSDISVAYRNAIANYLRGAGAPVAIASLYLELFNGDPQGAGTSVHAAITGSANRFPVAAHFGAAAAGVSQSDAFTIIDPTVGTADFTHVAFYDAVTAGNLVMSHAVVDVNGAAVTQHVVAGNALTVSAAALKITIA